MVAAAVAVMVAVIVVAAEVAMVVAAETLMASTAVMQPTTRINKAGVLAALAR